MNIFLLISFFTLFQQTTQWVRLNTHVVEVTSGTQDISIEFEIDSGYHIQSDKPYTDNLIPTSLELESSDGVEVLDIKFPEPHDYELKGSDEVMAVFDGKMRVIVRLKIEASMPLRIPGKFCYQVCDDRKCYFPRCLEFTLKIDPSAHR